MEPTTTPSDKPRGKEGSLNNPEIVENVPGHVIPILEHEFDDFDNEAEKFLGGETPENEYIPFRLRQGVYGQRQADVQMIRVKLPMGGITPEQWEAFADVTEKYAPVNKSHITTRQNIQLHHIPLRDAAALIREISAAGLSSREGCGNTVRNVTGDPYAGVCDDEPFDVTPWAGAYVRYFVRHPTTQLMPRKIKTAFTASDADRAITGIHDIAFLPRVREDGTHGVEVRVGGGTAIMPRVAPTLYDFVELANGDYLKVSEAVFRIFDRQDFLRVNRARARIKVLVDKIGMDAFREMVDEELRGDWVNERDFDPTPLLMEHDEEANAPAAGGSYAQPGDDAAEFERFKASNVRPQRQEGFSTIDVRVYRGDLSPEQMRAIADLQREYSGGYARTTIEQNFVLRWVRDESRLRGVAEAVRAGPWRARRRRDPGHGLLPRHRQLQAGHHQLDGPERRHQREAQGAGHHRSADQADPHQELGLPQRLRAAPHREHRVLRRVDQGRRQDHPGLHPARGRQLRGRRGGLRPAAAARACPPSACRTPWSGG